MPAPQSDTETVTAGSISVTITGTFIEDYVASLIPSWNTTVWIAPSSKTAAQFVAQFGTPPPTDLDVDWGVLEDL